MNYISRLDLSENAVPEEKSLVFTIDNKEDAELTIERFIMYLDTYRNDITCVVFNGGEDEYDLPLYLDIVKSYKLKTCLYTDKKKVDRQITSKLNYIKVGRYIESMGSLYESTTNQRMYDLDNDEDITYKFWEMN